MFQRFNSGAINVVRRISAGSALAAGLPDTLIIGAQKAGTTSLFAYLADHPRVSASRCKEVHYFDNAFHRGETWYRRHFGRSRGDEVMIEASPYYLYHPLAAARASTVVPAAKLIVLLREPVARALSHYHHEVAKGWESLSFEEALASEPTRLADSENRLAREEIAHSFDHQHYSYRARGLYADQIERWLKHFPANAFLFLKAEEMLACPQLVFDRVCQFLRLPQTTIADPAPRHGRSYSPLAESTRKELRRFYAEPNQRVAELTGISWNVVGEVREPLRQ